MDPWNVCVCVCVCVCVGVIVQALIPVREIDDRINAVMLSPAHIQPE